MVEGDTVRLLRECDAGIKMGVSSIEDVIGKVNDGEFKKILSDAKTEHEELKSEIQGYLDEYGDEGKNPNPIAKGMSWMKTGIKLGVDESDGCIADLMTDGCDMGVKSLSRYLNQYAAADERSKNITKRLIKIEESMAKAIRDYL